MYRRDDAKFFDAADPRSSTCDNDVTIVERAADGRHGAQEDDIDFRLRLSVHPAHRETSSRAWISLCFASRRLLFGRHSGKGYFLKSGFSWFESNMNEGRLRFRAEQSWARMSHCVYEV